MERRTYLASVATLSIGSLGGCIEGSDPSTSRLTETPSATEAPTRTETSSSSPGQQEYPNYNWDVLDGTDSQSTTEVVLEGTAFDPLIAEVPKGTAISFPNEDSYPHSVTVPALDVDERLGGGESTTVTFDESGTFDYVCTLHPPSMLGRIVVIGDSQGTADDSPTSTPTSGGTSTPTETDDGSYY